MTTRTKYLIAAAGMLVSFDLGRYTVSAPETKTETSQTTNTDTESNKDTHKETTTITEKQPDGATTTTTKIVEDTVTKKDTETKTDSHTEQTVTPPKLNTLNLSVLAGIDLSRQTPVYGASVNKQLLGPITIGLFGLTNGTIGASVGLNF
jgi:hypothetical protein